MPKINQGLQNELNIIKAFNNKRYEDLNENLKNVAKYFEDKFPSLLRFKAKKCEKYSKADICISYKFKKHYLSIKTGTSTYLHCEWIKDFILYLRSFGISERTQKTILLFQYGDGTMVGNGKVRYSFKELYPKMKLLIDKANLELNSNKAIVLDFVNKCIFRGSNNNKEPADYIYHGDENSGVICSKKQIMRYVARREFDNLKTLHIGPITINPYARYTNFKEMHPDKRHIVTFQWGHLENNLKYISETFDS